MSKIICDVCGSAYADTADQCPICGTAKRDTNATKPEAQSESGYNYVKGGRFSHANVRKHNSGRELTRMSAEKPEEPKSNMPPLPVAPKPEKPKAEKPKPVREEKPKPVKEEKSKPVREEKPKLVREEKFVEEKDPEKAGRITNIILAVIVLILLALVVYAGIYIVRNYETLFPSAKDPTEPQGTQQTVGGVRIPCVGITLPALDKVESAGDPVDLGVTFNPSTTTDEVTYVSSDPAVATVNFKGQITVHSTGSVVITITCGDQTAELSLECVFVIPTEPNDPTDPTGPSQPVTPPIVEGKLLFVDAKGKETKDVTFTKYGEEFQLYKGEVDASYVTFTSSNPDVVTVDAKGKIKVVGKGEAVITAQYGDQKIQCSIRCNKVEVPVSTGYEISFVDKKNKEENEIDYTRGDVTIYVGGSIMVQLYNRETGAPVSGLVWYQSMPEDPYISLQDKGTGVRVTGNEVTVGVPGVAYVRVMCDYEGTTYTCIIRVREKPETTQPAA
jgi:hypothetical protein